ncbi:hypothetical protein B0H11DRAFT_2034947 [Mycena galericulata]|nr:hypothetical protein B0H11DRAFT_2034947 [Mycena galericulata]
MAGLALAAGPFLPIDIEREILEFSALSHPKSIPTLLRVARRVKTWIEPFLFRIMSLRNKIRPSSMNYQMPALLLLDILKSKPTSFWREHVRHLSVGQIRDDEASRILATCTGVSNLALFHGGMNHLFPLLAVMPLVRLSASLKALFGSATIDFDHPLLSRLTHLEIFDVGPYMDSWSIGRLPSLSHISFNFPDTWARSDSHRAFFEGVRANCGVLEVLVLICDDDRHLRAMMSHYNYFGDNTRSVLVGLRDFRRDWELGAEGGTDYWVRAETFIKQRQSGEIPASDYVVFANSVEGYLSPEN